MAINTTAAAPFLDCASNGWPGASVGSTLRIVNADAEAANGTPFNPLAPTSNDTNVYPVGVPLSGTHVALYLIGDVVTAPGTPPTAVVAGRVDYTDARHERLWPTEVDSTNFSNDPAQLWVPLSDSSGSSIVTLSAGAAPISYDTEYFVWDPVLVELHGVKEIRVGIVTAGVAAANKLMVGARFITIH